MKTYYKLAMPSGFDFQTGNTIDYRGSIGKTVAVPNKKGKPKLCSNSVLHACPNPNDCFVGAKIPCSCFTVTGKPVVDDGKKFGFRSLKVLSEIPQEELDELFGWQYSETCKPVHPLKTKPPQVNAEVIALLKEWASVWDSVGDSVRASVGAYIGSLFPNIKKWKYITHEQGEYPFVSASKLWRMGLVPSFDGKTWRLHGGKKAEVLFEISRADLEKWKP
ncbi:hypothetical protein MUP79_09785 [Candidatus Bathyarchaeota archaeon]|nr:hypothetical protein [Candidatus Bathyarchaeota archaeon]